jgi:putative N-acetylmannosamine-6-phosphate epimerase
MGYNIKGHKVRTETHSSLTPADGGIGSHDDRPACFRTIKVGDLKSPAAIQHALACGCVLRFSGGALTVPRKVNRKYQLSTTSPIAT